MPVWQPGQPWRIARCLDILLSQVNACAPRRSKASDGSIADANHSPSSDHYPHYLPGLGSSAVVTARDITHDPAAGADMAEISEALRRARDPRIKYVIFSRRIFSSTSSPTWTWTPYDGDNPHTQHMHISAVGTAAADGTQQWEGIGMGLTAAEIDAIADKVWSKRLNDDAGWPMALVLLTNVWQELSGKPGRFSDWQHTKDIAGITSALTTIGARDWSEEVASRVLAGLTPERIAAAIPPGLAEQVVDALAVRLRGEASDV